MTTQLILNLDSVEEFSRILELLKEFGFENKIQIKTKTPKPVKTALKPRQAGWGKDFLLMLLLILMKHPQDLKNIC